MSSSYIKLYKMRNRELMIYPKLPKALLKQKEVKTMHFFPRVGKITQRSELCLQCSSEQSGVPFLGGGGGGRAGKIQPFSCGVIRKMETGGALLCEVVAVEEGYRCIRNLKYLCS